MYNVEQYGQIFTPQVIVNQMVQLRKNFGSVLEPSSGDGAFMKVLPKCVGIEIDARHCPRGALNMDFFDYPLVNTFDTIIGNPPYVRYQDILLKTKRKLRSNLFDERSNLYLFFIEKCIKQLKPHGELIFITPRDFFKATSSIRLNEFIYGHGTITHVMELGDKKIFNGYNPNCVIWRFEKDNFSRITNGNKKFICKNGQLLFTEVEYSVMFSDVFYVKVGAVSGRDKVFANDSYGNADFVCSSTYKTGKTRKMIFNTQNDYLEEYKDVLLSRRIKPFNESNWWQWGRMHHVSSKRRIYVNAKTRSERPFFIHACKNYDGSVLAIFPRNPKANEKKLCEKLNAVNWLELGFVCDGRYLFSQKSLQNTFIPDYFKEDIVPLS